jgi:hypothetical protein
VYVCVAVCDHFEPAWQRPTLEIQRRRVDTWVERYPRLAASHRDAWGRPPQHTFFYPAEEYHSEHLDKIAALCRSGYGDVEVHLHHDADTAAHLRGTLNDFTRTLHERHGLLRTDPVTGRITWAFIHGNWALDNSRPDGRWCGVNDELQVLRDAGCYADFTFPSAPSDTQPRTSNAIYYATDDPARPKSHDRGVEARAGVPGAGDLLLITGPLALNWRSRKWGVLPRIENGELSSDSPPSPQRADHWIAQHVHVAGRPDWVFVKLHTHGAQESAFEVLLGEPMDRTLQHLETAYNDGERYRLVYLTAREMYEAVKAIETGTIEAWAAGRAAAGRGIHTP